MKKIYFYFTLLILFSCDSKHKNICNDDSYCLEVVIRSSRSCAYIIEVSKNGHGLFTKGQVDDYKSNDFAFDKVDHEANFKIQPKEKLDSLFDIMETINNKEDIIGIDGLHAVHVEVYISGNKKIDVYRKKPDVFWELLNHIESSLPFPIDKSCW